MTTCAAPAVEAGADVFLTFIDDVILKLLPRIARQIAIELIKQIHHGGRDHSLMERFAGHFDGFFDKLARIEIVAERAAGHLGQLAIVAIGKDREILPSGGKVRRQSGAGERVGDRIGGEARDALLAVGDDRRASRFEALKGIGDGGILLLFQLGLGDLLRVVVRVRPAAASAAAESSRPARWGCPWQSLDCSPSLLPPVILLRSPTANAPELDGTDPSVYIGLPSEAAVKWKSRCRPPFESIPES